MHKILIIDDEKNILDSLSGILEDEGFTVSKAMDGKEGLDVFDREAPDVVLLDVWMPEMDGIQVLKEIKTRNKDARVVVISGHGTISTAVEAVKMGAYDFLEKPLSIEKVLEVVYRSLAQIRPRHPMCRFQVQGIAGGRDQAKNNRQKYGCIWRRPSFRGKDRYDPAAHAGKYGYYF